MASRIPQTPRRKSVLLALGWNVYEINFGVAEYAKKANWILDDLMFHSGLFPSQWHGDGIITLLNSNSSSRLIRTIGNTGLPVVNLGVYVNDFISAWVLPDNQKIGSIAANHFLTRGFDRFAFYRMSSASVVMERLASFRDAVLKAGKQFYEISYETVPKRRRTQENLLPWLGEQLRRLPKPLAAMAQYDADANDIVRAALSANLIVPDDVAVVGVDNDPVYSQLGPVPLSSVASNRRLAGYRAAELLDQFMKRKPPLQRRIQIAPSGIVVRMSSDLIAVKDADAAKALRFIWEHFHEPITVRDVIAHVGTSRRTLYSRFEQHVGHPIQRELTRQRMEKAKQLLRETNKKLHDIACASGLDYGAGLGKAFTRFCGVSPSTYRDTHRTSFVDPAEGVKS